MGAIQRSIGRSRGGYATHTAVDVYVHVHVHVYDHVYVHVHVYVYVHMHVYDYVYEPYDRPMSGL